MYEHAGADRRYRAADRLFMTALSLLMVRNEFLKIEAKCDVTSYAKHYTSE